MRTRQRWFGPKWILDQADARLPSPPGPILAKVKIQSTRFSAEELTP